MVRIVFIFLLSCWHVVAAWAQQHEADAPLPPLEAAQTMWVPDGVEVTLFAGEPDVMQPIGFCIDDRGRLWVAEAYNYPVKGKTHGDRIIILADTDGDGRHDQRKVFFEGLEYVTGIEVGFGGVWVMSPPNLYFIPDNDYDGVPDGPRRVVLDGFGTHANAHNLANGFAWGPDGWLYGTHGRTNWSMIGKPGTPNDQRIRFDGGVYRYHPVRDVWEPYADGTTNPWGIDWNDYGHAFICNCVNPHLFQVIQGAHYDPWRGRRSSQYAYQRIASVADHLHFVGRSNIRTGIGTTEEDAAGGGHAHCGSMIYLGDNFPDSYRNTFFTNNIHGRRINNDILRRRGSGYVASHGPDLMKSQDRWFMGVTLAYGPGGEIYVSDWSDTGECHSTHNTRRHTGRIYRLTYGDARVPAVDLTSHYIFELAQLQIHRNDWYVRHARRLLQERAAAGQDMSRVHDYLRIMFKDETSIPRKLRAMWALHVTGGLDASQLAQCLNHDSEHVRSWAVTLLIENGSPSVDVMRRFVELAAIGDSALVRLSLASGLQRLATSDRWELAAALASRGEDQADQNLPLMIWYGCEPLIDDDLLRFSNLAATAAIPRIRINIARRIASSDHAATGLELLVQHLASGVDDDVARDLLDGILQGVEGRRRVPMPTSWQTAYGRLSTSSDAAVRGHAVQLAVLFDDQSALQSLQRTATDDAAAVDDRIRAIEALVARRSSGFDDALLELLHDASVREAVLKGLAAYNHPHTARDVLRLYEQMDDAQRRLAVATLASRKAWANDLLDAVEEQLISPGDISAFNARQLRALRIESINKRLAHLWGEVRETPRERVRQIAKFKQWLTDELLADADRAHGARLFNKQCANCHRFFGQGGEIGPDITGSQRTNLDYLLETIIDPSASVANDYQMEIIETVSGRVFTGLVEPAGESTIAVQSGDERIVIPLDEIDTRTMSTESIMPQGLLDSLTETEIRDLVGYLQSGPAEGAGTNGEKKSGQNNGG